MKDLELVKKILDMEIKCDKEAKMLWLSQTKYSEWVLNKVNIKNVKLIRIPLEHHFKLSLKQNPSNKMKRNEMKNILYFSTIGSMMYAIISIKLS